MPIQFVMISLFILILKIGIAIRTTQGIRHHQFDTYFFVIIGFCANKRLLFLSFISFILYHSLKSFSGNRWEENRDIVSELGQ